jgi:diacylglycerol kinase (ATP)
MIALFLLVLTWVFVIPYLIMYPPAMSMLLVRRKRASRLRAMSLPAASFDLSQIPSARIRQLPLRSRMVLVFINTKSGGQCGASLLRCFNAVLPSSQVFDMSVVKPEEVLSHIAGLQGSSGARLAVCGGDGTVGWVLEAAAATKLSLPVAIMPLGTGNDLARSMRWGGGVASRDICNEFVTDFLVNAVDGDVRDLDQWEILILSPSGKELRKLVMNNYFSFGVDATIALKFHEERQRHPDRFSSQQANVMKYAFYGFEGAFEGVSLENTVAMREIASDSAVEIPVNPYWKGLIVSNVPCYHGGKNFWGDADGDSFLPNAVDDGLLEVMGLSGTLHIGLVNLAIDQSLRLAQVKGIEVVLSEATPMQVDGEPWVQEPCTIRCTFKRHWPMVQGPAQA